MTKQLDFNLELFNASNEVSMAVDATNKILVGNELIEEYLFDETKKAELEKGLKNLVNNLCEMIEDEDTNLTNINNGCGRIIILDTDTVYDMIDSMYLSLSWKAPRWGKATDRTYTCFAYGKEREILAREVALKLGAYNDVVLLNLGTNDIKSVSFEDWYSLSVEQRDEIILETEHDFIYANNIFIPEEITEVVKLTTVLEVCKDYNFNNSDMLEVADGLFAYPEENGDGYILDAEDFKGELINDTLTHCQVTNCYYWRNENNKIQIEAIDFKNDPDQHERQVEAGHKVIYDTMYLIAPYFKTYFGEL